MSCRATIPSSAFRCFFAQWTPAQLAELAVQLGVRFRPGDAPWDQCQQLISAINELPEPISLRVYQHCRADTDYAVVHASPEALPTLFSEGVVPPDHWVLPFTPEQRPLAPYGLIFHRSQVSGMVPQVPLQLVEPLSLAGLEFIRAYRPQDAIRRDFLGWEQYLPYVRGPTAIESAPNFP